MASSVIEQIKTGREDLCHPARIYQPWPSEITIPRAERLFDFSIKFFGQGMLVQPDFWPDRHFEVQAAGLIQGGGFGA